MKPHSVIIPHYDRRGNLIRTLRGLARQTELPAEVIVVDMGDGILLDEDYPFHLRMLTMKEGRRFLPIAGARNLGAEHSCTDRLVFLDVDCIPAKDFCERMVTDSVSMGGLLMGSPKYIVEKATDFADDTWCQSNSIFHPSRPLIQSIRKEACYELFWSLCFAISKEQFDSLGGFDSQYEGYGIEDTDFALKAKRAGVPFYLNEAEVYHQQHPIYVPPLNQLESIIANSNRFFSKWGYWPMGDCLEDFAALHFIDWNEHRKNPIEIVKKPSDTDIKSLLVENAPYR